MKKTYYLSMLLLVLFGSTSLFAQNKVLFIGGGTTRPTASLADRIGMNYLESSGYVITYHDDNDPVAAIAADTVGKNVIVISSTVGGSNVTHFAWSHIPIIVWEYAAFDDYGLIYKEFATQTESTYSIVNMDTTSHPILANFSYNDTIRLTYSNNGFMKNDAYTGDTLPSSPGKRAKMLTKFVSDNNNPQTYTPMAFFEKGDTFNIALGSTGAAGKPANGRLPARRVASFLGGNSLESITPEGLTLFLNSVDWAIDGVMNSTVPVAAVGLDVSSLSLVAGETATRTAVLFPSNYTGAAPAITYTSQYDTIATFVNGTITAIKAGTTKIYAQAAGVAIKDSITLTITDYVAPTGVSLNIAGDTLIVGETAQLTATVAPATASYKTVTWSSSADTIATVSTTGKVTAVRDGNAMIIVTTTDGGFKDTVNILVNKIPVTGVSLNLESDTVFVGATIQLVATIAPTNASFKTVSWLSTATSVATVDAAGLVTAVGAGNAKIIVTTDDEAKKDTFNITVEAVANPVTGVTLNIIGDTLLVGETVQLTETVAPANADLKTVTWSSTAPAVATVSATGLVSAVSVGTASIVVKTDDGNFRDTVSIKVNPVPVSGVTLNKTTSTILIAKTDTLIATVAPANAANKSVTWSTSDATVATVSATGVVTAVKIGTATITVTTVEGGKTATCVVTVTPVSVTSIKLTYVVGSAPATSDTINVGASTSTIKATVLPNAATYKTVSWTSSHTDIATVTNATGETTKITGVAKGVATITATADGVSATFAITVSGPSSVSDLSQVNCEVYPNPVTDILKINAENITSVSIINAVGSQVMRVDSDFENGIDVSGLEAGLYVVNVLTTEGTTAKVVIKK